jgi:hypothetical protein
MPITRLFSKIPAVPAVILALLLSGCGALPITLAGVLPIIASGAGGGVAYTMTNIAYKTFSYPIGEVEGSLHAALEKMEIKEVGSEKLEYGVNVTAETRKLDIYIWMEEVTASTTRVKVNAKKGAILKDKATATEIIVQIEKGLEDFRPVTNSPRRARPETHRTGSVLNL